MGFAARAARIGAENMGRGVGEPRLAREAMNGLERLLRALVAAFAAAGEP
jgi:hypothetical protein